MFLFNKKIIIEHLQDQNMFQLFQLQAVLLFSMASHSGFVVQWSLLVEEVAPRSRSIESARAGKLGKIEK